VSVQTALLRTYADVCWRMLTYADACVCADSPAYFDIDYLDEDLLVIRQV
jgi:hypothetical protein